MDNAASSTRQKALALNLDRLVTLGSVARGGEAAQAEEIWTLS
jgi:hypothetical protein